ncbi:uncharacterized protein Z518_00599 [Rhinocladiella mackenziei CBS 650.93]|uniref:SAP domain-containing protein n=1 Tax=Rhinocladiella mackenziei CBS 650.93 TaxID=1442369 RepID=A0A0D2ITX9_9EURO|nr:uncharacterized protein Z518_00599 [Rhinocladiella mackenziei CBS 650.93]KIX09519.1 hypothetical protein Z518_00599 [Rhinocladiella mackenziei CBS 650.93]
MTDWTKLKVADLKEECKARGIPLTGLKLKQHYVDKLAEHEAGNTGDSNVVTDDAETTEPQEQDAAHLNGSEVEPHDEVMSESKDAEQDALEKPGIRDGKPQELQNEDNRAEDVVKSQEGVSGTGEAPLADHVGVKDTMFTPEPTGVDERIDTAKQEIIQAPEHLEHPENSEQEKAEGETKPQLDHNAPSADPALYSTPIRSSQLEPASDTPSSSQMPPSDLVEDQRRRKRSATPVPTAEEMARKKARLSEDEDSLKARETSALEPTPPATEPAQEIRGEHANGAPAEPSVEEISQEATTTTTKPLVQPEESSHLQPKSSVDKGPSTMDGSRSPSEERDVTPAIHPATSSIYIRNFKRPLHIPSLRSHIVSIAKSWSSRDDSDPITVFYLDSIRTHAFITFTSVAAASRVRSAMHETRYPNESMRDPLFVDYVPDDKVQPWIDQESGGGLGHGGSGRRFEVVYENGDNGVEAIFQEVDLSKPQHSSESNRNSRMSIDRSKSDPVPAGVHPDRAAFVPRDTRRDEDRHQDRTRLPTAGLRHRGSVGTGFKALDELFDSTIAKPKLYYKPVPDSVARDRLDMFQDLRLGYAEMGRSGDEGMKRYSFERYRDREEWVDKGPEFGYGKRGQNRLAGIHGGRAGYRGRGGDSWRGTSGRR